MKCLGIDQIYLYLEKELPSEENKKIEEHIATCLKCKKCSRREKPFTSGSR